MRHLFRAWCGHACILSSLLMTFVCPAQAGLVISEELNPLYIERGNDPRFAAVGALAGRNASGRFLTGTAFLVSPWEVATVGHVFDFGWTEIDFILGADARSPISTVHPASEWFVHPDFVSGDPLGSRVDFAIIRLAQPIYNVTPLQMYWGDVAPGTHIDWASYGVLAYPNQGEAGPAGIKRGGENVIDRVGWPALGISDDYFAFDFGPNTGTQTLPLELGGTNVSSGTPTLTEIDGLLKVNGLVSFAIGDLNTLAFRPAGVKDFYDAHVTTSVPEPSSGACMLIALFSCVMCPRVRRSLSFGRSS